MLGWRGIVAVACVVVAAAVYSITTASESPSTGTSSRLVVDTADPSPDEVEMRAPAQIEAGLVEIVLRNRGDTLHDAQLVRVDGKHDAANLVGVLEQSDGTPKPRWMHPAGGVAATAPGETATASGVLEPGTYYVVDTQERTVPSGARIVNAGKHGISRLEVRGRPGGELPDTAATITADEYGFDADGIVAGANRVTFRNAGRQLHQVVALPIQQGLDFRTARQGVLAGRADTGWVPVDVSHRRATAVLEGGRGQVSEMRFSSGRYLLLCFVSDRAGGGPQWTLGMTSELTVGEKP
jgi:hypothetical protein